LLPDVVLFAWPLISIGLFAALDVRRGLILSVLIGYLFLPDSYDIDLPLVAYNKPAAIAVGLVLSYAFFGQRWRLEVDPSVIGSKGLLPLMFVLLAVYFLTPILVVLTNQQGYSFGFEKYIPGHTGKDAIRMFLAAWIHLVPMLMGWWILSRDDDHKLLLRYLVVAVLGYSLLAVFEIRMSPQLNNWIYGYFPHDWLQHIRGGSFRPVVFLSHGLMLGFLLLWGILASLALMRLSSSGQRLAYLAAAIWLLLVLLASRNLGATLLAFAFLPVLLFLGTAVQIRVAAIVSIIFLLYPVVRQADVLPIDRFTSFIETISPERAHSFNVRLQNEQLLLERASEKPFFGWGGYGRSRIRNEAGQDISLVDGFWISVLGRQGWSGYISQMGLMTLPVIWLVWVRRRKPISRATAGVSVMMAVQFIDMVPNASLTPVGLLTAGALAGFVLKDRLVQMDGQAEAGVSEGPRRSHYTRFETRPGQVRSLRADPRTRV